MEETYTMEFTAEELTYLLGGVTLTQKEAAENFYKSLEGLKSKEETLSVEEYDAAHKVLMGLYSKLGDKIKEIMEGDAQ
jgi:hypothetical protein